MSRLTGVDIDSFALLHNLNKVKSICPQKKIIAMVKANAYGCGFSQIIPILEGQVDLFGVACMEEALVVHGLGARTPCLLAQGVFTPEEYKTIENYGFHIVIHRPHQLQWLLESPLTSPQKIWVKVNTGMNRLGFHTSEVYEVIDTLKRCPWVQKEIGLMTHFACADEQDHPANAAQLEKFQSLLLPEGNFVKSLANSAALLNFPDTHADYVRPGIMLYGVSPFKKQDGQSLGLKPVMQFRSILSAIQHYPQGISIGYGATWQTLRASVIGMVAAGYADGYPRHLTKQTHVWINGFYAPVVGRVSMDMLTVDLTDCPPMAVGDKVELWGARVPVEEVAISAETLGYELLCQFSSRGLLHK